MRIMPIMNVNRAYLSTLNINNTKNYMDIPSGDAQPTQDKVSFTGPAFGRLFSPNIVKETQAIDILRSQEQGLFIKLGDGFAQSSFPKLKHVGSNTTEYTFKRPEYNEVYYYCGGLKAYGKYRLGFLPYDVISALKSNAQKVTAVVNEGVQVLHLPKDPQARQKALQIFASQVEFDVEPHITSREIFGAQLRDSFKDISLAIEEAGIEGLKLEKVPFSNT